MRRSNIRSDEQSDEKGPIDFISLLSVASSVRVQETFRILFEPFLVASLATRLRFIKLDEGFKLKLLD